MAKARTEKKSAKRTNRKKPGKNILHSQAENIWPSGWRDWHRTPSS